MKKKKRLIPLAIIGVILIVFISTIGALIFKGYGASTGVYLESKDGKAILVLDNTPVVMSNRTSDDLFSDLDIGDKIFVIHDGINESYPGSTGAYAVFRISNGTESDVPQTVINQLIELGWYKEDAK